MTKEEAIEILKQYSLYSPTSQIEEAIDMAIEALSQPIVAKHFDIQSGYIYCSPQIAENVKVVVRCKDCRFWKNEHLCLVMSRYGSMDTKAEHYCSYGERREE